MKFEEYPGFFRIEVPLPGSPLKELNAYLVLGKERSLLIDSGFNMPEARQALDNALLDLEVDRDRLDFFITHLHADHNGLTGSLQGSGSRIFCGEIDGHIINEAISDPVFWEEMYGNLARHGFPADDLKTLATNHPGKIYANSAPLEFTYVAEGDELEYGNYHFRIISAPGHTPGHMTLYELSQNFLISGDHILGSITPNITSWNGFEDSLGDYLRSLDKINQLDVDICFPGHRAIVPNMKKRIQELREHHKRRLKEAYDITREKIRARAWDVAAVMSWSLRGDWPSYAPPQKCFAVGEAVAHLEHLAVAGRLKRSVEDGEIFYSIN